LLSNFYQRGNLANAPSWAGITVPQPLFRLNSVFFGKMKYLLEKETHNKNGENIQEDLNGIFLTVNGLPK
jgi:hypothetical protein